MATIYSVSKFLNTHHHLYQVPSCCGISTALRTESLNPNFLLRTLTGRDMVVLPSIMLVTKLLSLTREPVLPFLSWS